MAVAEVKAIIPEQVIELLNGKETKKVLEEINKDDPAFRDEVTNSGMTEEEKKIARNRERRFKGIRQRLICEAFGLDPKQLEQFMEDYKGAKAHQESGGRTEAQIIRDKKDAAAQANTTIKARDRDMRTSIVSFAATLAMQNPAVVAAVGSINAALPGIGTVFSAAILAFAIKRYFKARKQDLGDKFEKDDDYEKNLVEFVKKIKLFESKLNQMKDDLLKQLDGTRGKERDRIIKDIAQKLYAEVQAEFGVSNEAARSGFESELKDLDTGFEQDQEDDELESEELDDSDEIEKKNIKPKGKTRGKSKSTKKMAQIEESFEAEK